MSLILPILQIAGGLVGVFASWYISRKAVLWLTAYRKARISAEAELARSVSQQLNQKANAESDRLREIDGR